MKILLISDYNRIALDLNTNLNFLGHSSTLLTTKYFKNSNVVINISQIKIRKLLWFLNIIRAFWFRYIVLWIKDYLYFQDIVESSDYYSIKRIKKKIKDKPELIIILFDYRVITAKTISDLYEWSKAKIFWMIVDMKPMTGGCSYAQQCINYQTGCHVCPAINNKLFKNFAHEVINNKIYYFNSVDLHIIAGSTYQSNQAKSSLVFKNTPIDVIYFPCDERIFKYRNKNEARKTLGIKSEKKVILWGAENINAPRKGYKYLIEALNILKEGEILNNIILLSVGTGVIEEINALHCESINLGWVDFEKLSLAYQASDLFVCPSIEDSGPIMVNQSIMCGTPVVAFKMGINLDLVIKGRTGYLAELENPRELAQGILSIISMENMEREQMSKECIEISKKLNHQAFYHKLNILINSV